MNRACHRIVFNQKRGQLMVVAESAAGAGKGAGKGGGTTAGRGEAGTARWAMLRPLGFSLLVAFGGAAVLPAAAQVVAYKAAPGGQRPTVLSAGNGVPVVNIQTPSAAGVSHNAYGQFDVGPPGVLLNNSRGNVSTQLGGWIQGNPWLARGTARVILNEVISTNPSLLSGYLEVAGDKAQVIVANPAGVTCTGCGFLNAHRVTLTTGTPLLSGGALDGYRVEGGTVRIDGTGMDAARADATDLIARAVEVNAGLWAQALRITAGANRVDAAHTQATPIAGAGPVPAFALDVAPLGGLYAGKIVLVGTEAGVGVRNAGTLAASAGEVLVTAAGQLINRGTVVSGEAPLSVNTRGLDNRGTLASEGTLTVASPEDILNSGLLHAGRELLLATDGQLATTGTLDGQRLDLAAGTFRNAGSVRQSGTQALLVTAARVDNSATGLIGHLTPSGGASDGGALPDGGSDGTVSVPTSAAGGTLTAAATSPASPLADGRIAVGTLTNTGTLVASGTFSLTATEALTNAGTLTLERLTAAGTAFRNQGAVTAADAAFNATTLDNRDGTLAVAGPLTGHARELFNAHGTLHHTGGDALSLQVDETLDNQHGQIASNGSDLELTAAALDNTDGRIEHAGRGALTLTGGRLTNAGGTLASQGAVRVQAGTTGTVDNAAGRVSAAGTLTLATGTLDNRGGTLAAADALTVTAATLDNRAGGQIVTDAALAVTTTGALANAGGTLSSQRALTLAAGGDLANAGGWIVAGTDLTLHTDGALDNAGGTLGAVTGAVDLTAGGALTNTGGRLEAAKGVVLSSRGLSNTGGIVLGQTLAVDIHGQALDNTQGTLAAETTLALDSGALTNTRGLIQAGGALTLDTHGQALINRDTQGESLGIRGQGAVTLTTGAMDNAGGLVRAGTSLALTAATLDNRAGRLLAQEALALDASSALDNRGGDLQAGGNLTARAAGRIDNGGGLMRANGTLALVTAHLDNTGTKQDGTGIEAASVDITAGTLDNAGGAVRATAALTVSSAGTLDNTGGLISSQGTLALLDDSAARTLAVTNTGGTLLAGSALTLRAKLLSGDGQVLSHGDLALALVADFLNTGDITAARDLRLTTAGTVTNDGTLQAGDTLAIAAQALTNAATGTLAGDAVDLAIAGALTNRGLIDGGETRIHAGTLDNLGTGRLYGDHLAVAAGTLNNLAEGGVAPVIAARERLDLGVGTLANRDGALIFAAGDLALGGSLDADGHATGQAGSVTNHAATVESLGNLALAAGEINNTNGGLTLAQVTDTPVAYDQFTPRGHIDLVLDSADYPDAQIGNVNLEWRWADDVRFREYWRYVYTGTTTREVVVASRPGTLVAGGDMTLTGDVTNSDSRILAGQTLSLSGGTLHNLDSQGQAVTRYAGTTYYYDYDGWESCSDPVDGCYDISASPYGKADSVSTYALGVTRVEQHAGGSGNDVTPARTQAGASGAAEGAGAAHTQAGSGTATARITQVAAANAGGPAALIATAEPTLALPANRLYHVAPGSTAGHLVETDPAFARYRSWLSSDTLLKALGLDPALAQKRLGDGFYEQRLLAEQIGALTGRRFLDGYANDEDQYRALMAAGASVAQAWHLIPGVALTAEQMAQLTTDIVWLVEQTVTLADGSTQRVLVPQVYVRTRPGDVTPSGSLIAANHVALALTADLVNSGTIAGRSVVALTAENIRTPGRIIGRDVAVQAATDLTVQGGTLEAERTLIARAGRDLTVASTTHGSQTARADAVRLDRVAGLYVTGENGTLVAAAGHDLTLLAAAIVNAGAADAGGATLLAAGHDLTLGTVSTGEHQALGQRKDSLVRAERTDVGSTVATAGDLTLAAGNDLTARAAQVTAGGALAASAGHDLTLTAGDAELQASAAHYRQKNRLLSTKNSTTQDTLDTTTAISSSFSGDTVALAAGNDLTVKGSSVVAQGDLTAVAGRDLIVDVATGTHGETHFAKETEEASGFGKALGALTIIGGPSVLPDLAAGASLLTRKGAQSDSTLLATEVIGSTFSGGRIETLSGRDTRITGSIVVADGAIALTALRDLTIESAQATLSSQTHAKSSTSGFVGSFWQPAIGTVKQGQAGTSDSTTHVMSQIASLGGDVTLTAGQNYTQTASQVLAPKGDIAVTARRIDIGAVMDSQSDTRISIYKKTAIGGSISVPLIDAVKSIHSLAKSASHTDDPRMEALAATTAAMQAKAVYDSAQALAGGNLGGIKISVSLGTSKSESHSEQAMQMAVGSTLAAGHDLTLVATGAGQDSNLIVEGSTLAAGHDVTLKADNQIALRAAQNSYEQHSTNKNSGASIGIGFSFGGQQNGFTLDIGANKGQRYADGTDVTWTNTHVTAGSQLSLESGGDTTLKGAVVSGDRVIARVGGNLSLESLQDTAIYDSQQKSGGFGISLCIPPFCYGASSGSVSAGKSQVKSDYASVTEQTALLSGDDGFDITVKGNTDLKGAVITSTQKALDENKNVFTTGGTLSVSDIQNHAHFEGSGYGVTVGFATKLEEQTSDAAQGTMTNADKGVSATPAGVASGAGLGQEAGSAGSLTRAGITGLAGNIDTRAGDARTGIARIFDAEKVQKEIDAQVTITQTFAQQASQLVEDYARQQRAALQAQLKEAAGDAEKAAIQARISDINTEERIMNVLIGAVTGMGGTAALKESLSLAAEQMRDYTIKDSQKFKGIQDGDLIVTNFLEGKSEGVRGDGLGTGGTRIDLDNICGTANERCKIQKNPDGSNSLDANGKTILALNADGYVQFDAENAGMSLAKYLDSPEGQAAAGQTGGIQGWKGTLFGIPYPPGSWQDKLIESFGGSHDFIGGTLTGLYDEQGNTKRGMGETEQFIRNRVSELALITRIAA